MTVGLSVSENHYLVSGRIYLDFDTSALALVKVTDDEDNPYLESVNTDILPEKCLWVFDVSNGCATLHFTMSGAGSAKGGELYRLTFLVLDTASDSTAISVRTAALKSNSGKSSVTAKATTVNGTVAITRPVNTQLLTPLDPSQYYGRQLLLAEDPDLAEAYDYLGTKVQAYEEEIDMSRYVLTLDEFEKVLRYYHDDHPEVFWLDLSYSYSHWNNTYLHTMYQSYIYTKDEWLALKAALETESAKLLDGITNETPYADRVRLVHDRLIMSADYDTTYLTPHAHDLLGVIVDKTGVCESYARAFQYLMYRCGIDTILQVGQMYESGEHHMWNILYLNGDWYQMDTTWNDPVFETPNPDYIRYNYYNITTEEMEAERRIYRETSYFNDKYYVSYPYPECTATAENFFVKNAVEIAAYSPVTIGKEVADSILENGVVVLRPLGTYTLEALYADITNGSNLQMICIEANKYLPADKQLRRPGYAIDIIEKHGVISLHLRDYS